PPPRSWLHLRAPSLLASALALATLRPPPSPLLAPPFASRGNGAHRARRSPSGRVVGATPPRTADRFDPSSRRGKRPSVPLSEPRNEPSSAKQGGVASEGGEVPRGVPTSRGKTNTTSRGFQTLSWVFHACHRRRGKEAVGVPRLRFPSLGAGTRNGPSRVVDERVEKEIDTSRSGRRDGVAPEP
ncbi:hypothetical protein ACHAWF_005016, partial [Thalassiosira exigua]